MGLETVTYIDDLVITNPVASDKRHEGDDHLRIVKKAIKNSIWPIPGFQPPVTVALVTDLLTPGFEGIVMVGGAAAAADDLSFIDYQSHRDGALLLIGYAASGVITIKHNTGSPPANSNPILLRDGADLIIDATDQYVLLRRDGTTSWEEVWRVHPIGGLRVITTAVSATVPATPAANNARLVPFLNDGTVTQVAAGDDSVDMLVLDETRLWSRPGQGYVVISDAAHDWSALAAPLVPRYVGITPTAARIITLPTTGVPVGWAITIINLGTSALTIKASGGATIATFGAGRIELTAKIKVPTTAAHWMITEGGGAARPAFVGYIAAPATVTQTSATEIAVWTESYDNNANFDGSTRFTPTVLGLYDIVVNASVSSDGYRCYLGIHKNGSALAYGVFGVGVTGVRGVISVRWLIEHTVLTDYYSVYTKVLSGTAQLLGDSDASTVFQAKLIGYL